MNFKLIFRRLGYGTSLLAVAGTAAYSSYFHMKDVATLGHQRPELAVAFPFSVDGMMVVATLAIAEDKAQGRKPRLWARIALALGAVVSVAANVTSTAVHHTDPLSIAVSAWSPIALFVVVEIMSKKGKLIPAVAPVVPVAVTVPASPSVAVTPAPVVPAPVVSAPPVLPIPVVPQAPAPVTPGPVVQAQTVIRQTSATLPAPTSPAPAGASGALTTGPRAGDRVMTSPLTGRVLMDTPPRV